LHKFSKYFILIVLALDILSCKKKQDTTLGTDIQPESDMLLAEISDTATIQMHSIKHPKSKSYQDQFKYLGSNQDLFFGRTNASIFTNFSIPNGVTNISFGNDAILDSAELVLTFTQSYVGDTTNAPLYEVFQLTQSLDKTASYYMDTMLTYNSNPIASAKRRISKTSGFFTIRLPLNSAFASDIINNPQYLTDNTALHSVYKGFFITTKNTNDLNPNTKPGSLMKIDLDNTVSGVYVYYHNGSFPSSKQPKQYRFPFSGDQSSRFNNIEYLPNSGGTNLLTEQILLNDTNKGKQALFLKGVGGTKLVLRLPHLKNYSDSCPIAVNRAEVTLKVDPSYISSLGNYEPPPQISLVALDESGREIYIKDQYYSADLLKFGGNYDPVNKQYVFNMSRHVQDIVSGKIANYGFYVVVANPDKLYVIRRDTRAERVVFGGTDNATYKPGFKLTFIRFPYDK